jgi:signal transduction histidine kinase/tetratricopeptide (TPR) repeat protein
MGDLPESLAYSYKMLELAEGRDDRRRIANARNNLAYVFMENGEIERVLAILHQNAQDAAAIGYPRLEVMSTLNLASVYLDQGEAATARPYAEHGLQLSREAPFETLEVYALEHLGRLWLQLGDNASAIDYLTQALGAARRIGSRVTEARSLLTLGQAYSEIGQPAQALDHLQQCLAVAEAIQGRHQLIAAHLALSELYERQGDPALALAHYKQYHALKDRVTGEKADQRLKVLQVIHDTETARREADSQRLRADELQHEIDERARAEARLQRQLDNVRALSAFSAVLLTPAAGEAQRRQLLGLALQQLLGPAQASQVSLSPNVDDPVLGLCSCSFAHAGAPNARPATGETTALGGAVRQFIASAPPPEADSPTLVPWSLVPAELAHALASGTPLGGPTREVYAASPLWRDYLLHTAGVRALLLFPIRVGEQWWGCITLTDARNERSWAEEETLLLSTAAEMVASTIQRWQAEDQLRLLNNQLEAQVDARTVELREAIELLRHEVRERERAEAETREMVVTLEQRLAARTAEVATFFDLTLLTGQVAQLSEVFVQVLPRIIEVTRSDAIAIHLLDESRASLQLAGQLNLASDLPPTAQVGQLPRPFRRWIAQPNDPLLTSDLASQAGLLPNFHAPGLSTYLGAQIRVGASIAGVLSCYRASNHGYGLDEVALVSALAEQIGMMLANQQLRQSAQALAVVEERQRLARDLHDAVTQSLYSVALFAQAGREAAADGDHERVDRLLDELKRTTLHALREMRLLLYELRPADLQQEGLVRALQLRLSTVERRSGLRLAVTLDERLDLPPRYEVELYHIVVEALNNVLKHAAATALEVSLSQADGRVRAQIRDDGQGFDLQHTGGGMGLRNIRERVARLGGELRLVSAPGSGTHLEAVIPYREGQR